jgi:SAM-dependent methyltransferase
VDRVFSVSVIEHVPEAEIPPLMRTVWKILKPGGFFIATIDLFLNVQPFCSQKSNEFGSNIPITTLVEAAPFKLVCGERAELYGFPEFSVDSCMCMISQLLIGRYPVLVQCLVLEKI